MLMPSAVRLPGNHWRIIRKQGAGPLRFKQLLYIVRSDNTPNLFILAGATEKSATLILARALNGEVLMWVVCVYYGFHIRHLKDKWRTASWLTDSSCESQQDADTCFPELEARLWPSMKARWRAFAGIMSDWWTASCATTINNSFAQFKRGERFTNANVGYVYFFWKTHSSCIFTQYIDIRMHMPKDQTYMCFISI